MCFEKWFYMDVYEIVRCAPVAVISLRKKVISNQWISEQWQFSKVVKYVESCHIISCIIDFQFFSYSWQVVKNRMLSCFSWMTPACKIWAGRLSCNRLSPLARCTEHEIEYCNWHCFFFTLCQSRFQHWNQNLYFRLMLMKVSLVCHQSRHRSWTASQSKYHTNVMLFESMSCCESFTIRCVDWDDAINILFRSLSSCHSITPIQLARPLDLHWWLVTFTHAFQIHDFLENFSRNG